LVDLLALAFGPLILLLMSSATLVGANPASEGRARSARQRPKAEVASLKPMLTVQDVAAILGVPSATLYCWRYQGKGPKGIRVGRYVRYREEDVSRWLEEQAESK
jgi:excisionase family DNA binding protein